MLIDIGEIHFVPSRLLRKTQVSKFKLSDDNMMVAFTLDIGNTEFLTAGFKDLATNTVLPIKLESIGTVDFGCD